MQADEVTEADGLSDRALLRQYVERRSEAAFSRLVRRHLSLVYATCRREVGDPDLAEEVAQAVFLLLARKAPGLRAEAGLAGWLFQTARFAAKNALRQEARRQHREGKAAEMTRDTQAPEQGEDFWRQIEPHLNDALAHLGATDREAVLRRFFEGESLAEIGARLGLSENTARMRVARAVEKMRRHLSRAGVTLAGAALAALLLERAGEAAPAPCLAAVLRLAPMPGVLAPPPGPSGAHLHQFTQGVWKAMCIKTITTAAIIATTLAGAVAVPLVAVSAPKTVPTGAVPATASKAPPVVLRLSFTPGQTLYYKTTTDTDVTTSAAQAGAAGHTTMRMQTLMHQSVRAVRASDGAATVDIGVDGTRMTVNGKVMPMPSQVSGQMKSLGTLLILPTGRVLSYTPSVQPERPRAPEDPTGILGQFPTTPVGVGSGWAGAATTHVAGKMAVGLGFTLFRLEATGGKMFAFVALTRHGTFDADTAANRTDAAIPEQIHRMGYKENFNETGTLDFDVATGTVVDQATHSVEVVTMMDPQSKALIKQNTTSDVTLVRVPAPVPGATSEAW